MEIKQVIEVIRGIQPYTTVAEGLDIAIEALKKQIPTKVEEGSEGGSDWYCTCGNYLSKTKDTDIKYCPDCGQKLNWE